MKRIFLVIVVFIYTSFSYDMAVTQEDSGVKRLSAYRGVKSANTDTWVYHTKDSGEEFQFFGDACDFIRSKVRYVLRTDKNEYDYGNNVYANFSLRNDSEISVAYTVYCYKSNDTNQWVSYGVNQWDIVDENDQPISLTLWSKRDAADVYADNPELKATGIPKYIRWNGQTNFSVLVPSGKTYRVEGDFPLNQHLDLSHPGTYKAKAIRVAEYPSPRPPRSQEKQLESNTVEFRIRYGPEFTNRPLKDTVVGDTIDPPRLEDLPPAGDYSRLCLIVQSDWSQYQRMQCVFVHCFLKNESESEIHLCVDPGIFWQDQRWVVINENDEEVPLTRMGQVRFGGKSASPEGIDRCFSEPSFVVLPPGETIEIVPGAIQLNRYFDLTLPGKYKFKSLRNTMIPGQKFDSPLESNEVEFEIK